MQRHLVIATPVILFLSGMVVFAQGPKRLAPVVRQVDHILVESGAPKTLFGFFVDTLQFPAAWPLSENQGYVSGGVGLGNLNIELFRYSAQQGASRSKNAEARYSGLAFQPLPLEKVLPELKARGVPYNPPEPFISNLPDGSRGVAWTTLALPLLSKPGMSIFLYEYSPAFLKVEVRRRQSENRLILNHGGSLGVISAAEIVISTTHLAKDRESWTLLLGSPAPSGAWNAGAGPSIRLVQGTEDRIQEITLKVKSLQDTKAYLSKKKLLGSVSSGKVLISPSAVQRLRVLLSE